MAECFLTSCVRARFWTGSHTMPGQRHSQLTPTSLGQGCTCVFRCNLPPALLAEWPGSFTCHCGNKFSRRSCRDSNSQPLDHESGALTNKLSCIPSPHPGGNLAFSLFTPTVVSGRVAVTVTRNTDNRYLGFVVVVSSATYTFRKIFQSSTLSADAQLPD